MVGIAARSWHAEEEGVKRGKGARCRELCCILVIVSFGSRFTIAQEGIPVAVCSCSIVQFSRFRFPTSESDRKLYK